MALRRLDQRGGRDGPLRRTRDAGHEAEICSGRPVGSGDGC